MSKPVFSWDAFPDETVEALAAAMGYDSRRHGDTARGFLSSRVREPSSEFVKDYKNEIAELWLSRYEGAMRLVAQLREAGIGPMWQPRTTMDCARYVVACWNIPTLREMLACRMLRFGEQTEKGDEEVFTPRFIRLTTAKQTRDAREPHDYQRRAWEHLDKHLAAAETTGRFQGLLVMPTGSGKTYTAVRWLLERAIPQGMKVLWIAHRHELLDQAAGEFHRLASYAAPRPELTVRIVSGLHCSVSQIDPADDVVIASIAALARSPTMRAELVEQRRFLVVDEAHHAPASTYRTLIDEVQSRKPVRILGLTATPTRTDETERPELARLFGRVPLFQIDFKKLVELEILARPHIVTVKTSAVLDENVTQEDLAHLRRFQDLSERWLERIANLGARNQCIIDHLLSQRSRYGKTLVFAVNVHHAAMLTEQLREKGVNAEYVASYRPDGTEAVPGKTIEDFRAGRIDVLVNVGMLTEGVDVPDIKTVFLTRPTVSEILLRQMIGRALRGPKTRGKAEAFLVSFEDHWSRFREWGERITLEDLPEIAAFGKEDKDRKRVQRVIEQMPSWDLIMATVRGLRQRPVELKADAFEAIPHGWYVVEIKEEDAADRRIVPVYEHQATCWEALLKHAVSLGREKLGDVDGGEQFDEFFDDCDYPWPSVHDVGLVLEHIRTTGEAPEYHGLTDRQHCDPYEVAKLIRDQDLGERARRALIEERYTELAKAIYEDLREYRSAVEDALFELSYPEDSTRRRLGIPVFEPTPERQLSPEPHHNVQELLAESLVEGRMLLGLAEPLPRGCTVEWSKRVIKGWAGVAYWDPETPNGSGRIRINKLLNSQDVSADVLRSLLWHEYLHLYLKAGHTKQFRDLERKFPKFVETERELLNLGERFDIGYW